MSKRTERRAAEREARKLAFQELRQERAQAAPATAIASEMDNPVSEVPTSDLLARAQAFFNAPAELSCEPVISEASENSEAQLAANRANAQLSTGPRTSAGKVKSSQNALKHGLTSQTVVLAGEDTAVYNSELDSYVETFKPVGHEELNLVRSMLDCHWRLGRLLRIETAILLKGELEFADKFDDRLPAHRPGLRLAEIYLKYEKSLRNLNIQEARIRRCREKAQAELLRLQIIRKRGAREAEAAAVEAAAPATALQPQSRPSTAVPSKNGFDFSTHQYLSDKQLSKAA